MSRNDIAITILLIGVLIIIIGGLFAEWWEFKRDSVIISKIAEVENEIERLQVIADIRENYYLQILEAEITAYTSSKEECSPWYDGYVKAMIRVEDLKWAPLGIVAVDPKIIPLGSLVIVPSKGLYLACDIGKVITGNKLDILMASKKDALNWGKRKEKIAVLRKVKAY